MCRFLCSASAYQPPTVGEQYFRGRNSDRKGAKSHTVKKQFLYLYCNSNKKGFLTGNKIEITAMAFNDFSDRGKPDSVISG